MQHREEGDRGSWKIATEDGDLAHRLLNRRLSGVLDLHAGDHPFDAVQYRPAPELAEVIEHYWRVRWDIGEGETYTQHTLSNASVHLVIEPGRCRIQGIVTGRFTRVLEGRGRVFGVKFRPAGFRPFHRRALSELTDGTIPISAIFGPPGDALAGRILAEDHDARIVEACDAFFPERLPGPDPNVAMLNGIVARIVADRAITRVDQVVSGLGISTRTLQRLFGEYVGVTPKWVIARYRLHDAEQRLAEGGDVDLATLAQELGYYDQAHFANDFRALVGRPPGAYRRDTQNR